MGFAWFTLAMSTCALILLCVWALINQDKLFDFDKISSTQQTDQTNTITMGLTPTEQHVTDSVAPASMTSTVESVSQNNTAAEQTEKLATKKAESEKLAVENAKIEKLALEQAEAVRLAAEQAEAERLVAEQAEAEKVAAEQAEAERLAAEQAEAEKVAAEQAEAERLAAEQAEAERVAAEQAEAERLAAEQAEAERVAAEQAEADRVAAEQAETERLAAEQAEAERLAAEQAEAERLAAEQAEAERSETEAERLAAEKAEADRLAAETLQAGRLSAIPSRAIPVVQELAESKTVAAASESAFQKLRREELASLPGLAAQVRFEPKSIETRPGSRASLDRLFELLFLYSETSVTVQVASNEYEIDSNNELISRERALSLINYLIDRGLDEDRFRIRVLGKEQLPSDSHRVTVVATVIGE